jgi:hypothetical protein
MATLAQRINDLVTRFATEFKIVKTMLSGNNQGTLTGLNTTDKSNLLAAINEVNTAQGGKIATSEKGAVNGVAPLVNSLIPSVYLPAYVDDVLEFANLAAFPVTGVTGVLYLALDTNRSYRWSGTAYALIGNSGAVDSVFGRTGIIIAATNDYNSGQIANTSSVYNGVGPTVNNVFAQIHSDIQTVQGVVINAVSTNLQTLTPTLQQNVRTNINAYGNVEIGDPDTDFVAAFNAALV